MLFLKLYMYFLSYLGHNTIGRKSVLFLLQQIGLDRLVLSFQTKHIINKYSKLLCCR